MSAVRRWAIALKASAQQGFTSKWRSAQQGFTSKWRSAQQGFTLIELMVVVAIIGLASAAVILTMPDSRGRLADDGDRFAVRVAAARDEAVISARPMAVWISPSAYGFERFADGEWHPAEGGKAFGTISWRGGTRARLSDANNGRVMLWFDSTGIPSQAAHILLERDGEAFAITIDGAGRVDVGG